MSNLSKIFLLSMLFAALPHWLQAQDPAITKQPNDQAVLLGGDISFSVEVTGTAPITIQWQKEGVDIIGATGMTLDLTGVALGEEGFYQAVVSNGNGSVMSDEAELVVATQTAIARTVSDDFNGGVYPGRGTRGWASGWVHTAGPDTPVVVSTTPMDGGSPYLHVDLTTNGSVRNVFRQHVSGEGNDTIRWKFRLDEDATDFGNNFTVFNDRVNFFASMTPSLGGGTSATMSWGIFGTGAAHSSGAGAGQTFWIYDNVDGSSAFNLVNNLDTGLPIQPNVVYSFEVTVNGAAQTYTVSIVNEATMASFASAAPHTFRDLSTTATSHTILHFGTRASAGTSEPRNFDLDSIEVETTTAPLEAPAIVAQPQGRTVLEGTDVVLTVGATGSRILNYQWQKDGGDVGANSADLDLLSVTLGDAGIYIVTITNLAGEVTSDMAELVVIVGQPVLDRIVSDFDQGIFPGVAGEGWTDGWIFSGDTAPVVIDTDPVDGATSYLSVDLSGTSSGYRNVARQYESRAEIDVTQPHVIRWKFRLDEDPTDFEQNFVTFNDRIHFFSQDGERLAGGTSGGMGFGIFAVGAAHSSGVGAGRTFWIYDNLAGDSAFNLANNLDTGVPLIPQTVYSFRVDVDPANQTFSVFIENEDTGDIFLSSAPHTFRALSATAGSHKFLHFGVRASPDSDPRPYSIDSILITPPPVQAIVETFDDGEYPGGAEEGWVDPWQHTALDAGVPEVVFTDPIDGDTGYLHVNMTGSASLYRNVMRQYESTPDLNVLSPHTIRWKARLLQDPTDFQNTFTEFNDRFHFFANGVPRLNGGTSAGMTWGIFAHGAAHSSGAAAGQTFWLYDNVSGTSAFNLENTLDTGVPMRPNQVYDFEVGVDTINRQYWVLITNTETSESFTSAAPHAFRDLGSTLDSHTRLHFGLRVSAGDPRMFDLDSIEITTADLPFAPVIFNLMPPDFTSGHDADDGLRFRVISSEAIPEDGITVLVNGQDVSADLIVQGPPDNRFVRYAGLEPTQLYTVEISVMNSLGTSTSSLSFDTFVGASPLAIEVEDYNFNGGMFINDPDPSGFDNQGNPINQATGYVDRTGTAGTDYFAASVPVGDPSESYRFFDDVGTRFSDDVLRQKYIAAGVQDYDVAEQVTGDWQNYTRSFEAGEYHLFLRASALTAQTVALDEVTNDPTQPNQTTTALGLFNVPATGEDVYATVPLMDNDNSVVLSLAAGDVTLRLTSSGAASDLRLNFLQLFFIPQVLDPIVLIDPEFAGGQFAFSFQTVIGVTYVVEKTDSLGSPTSTWTELLTILGDGLIQTFIDLTPTDDLSIYRVRID